MRIEPAHDAEVFKADLKRWLTLYHKKQDPWLKLAAWGKVLEAIEQFAELWDKEIYELFAPAAREQRSGQADLVNGRRSATFSPAPRKGKRCASIDEAQEGLRAAAAMHFLVPTKGKEAARQQVALWLYRSKLGAETIDYWRDQGMNGSNEVFREQFQAICQAWTAKIADPERRAEALIKAHKRSHGKSFLERG